jgi:L-2-hydroxyglutarate oxidase LhgO
MNHEEYAFDLVVIGAGIVGIAASLAFAKGGLKVLLVEKNDSFGTGISSRNSEVIHSGIYYPKNSLKSKFCRRGMELLYEYCKKRGIAYRKIGKLIVQTQSYQEKKLQEIFKNGLENDCNEICLLEKNDLNKFEPEVKGFNAIWSPNTGIVDSHSLMDSMLNEFKKVGGIVVFKESFHKIYPTNKGMDCILSDSTRIKTKRLINATGLQAGFLTQCIEGFPKEKIIRVSFCKGTYFGYSQPVPFSHLVYPIPNNEGLGIHYTLDLNSGGRFGPDTEWVQNEDYSLNEARTGLAFLEIRKYWPKCDPGQLRAVYAGIRPKIGTKKEFQKDFIIQSCDQHNVPGLINLFGIESPGLTSALAIAEYLTKKDI